MPKSPLLPLKKILRWTSNSFKKQKESYRIFSNKRPRSFKRPSPINARFFQKLFYKRPYIQDGCLLKQ